MIFLVKSRIKRKKKKNSEKWNKVHVELTCLDSISFFWTKIGQKWTKIEKS